MPSSQHSQMEIKSDDNKEKCSQLSSWRKLAPFTQRKLVEQNQLKAGSDTTMTRSTNPCLSNEATYTRQFFTQKCSNDEILDLRTNI
jgi:hypothetical protein